MPSGPAVANYEIQVDLLGPLRIWVRGEDCTPSGRIRKAIVGLLALRSGRVVETETLLDHVWNGSPPPSARASLQMHITHIRRRFPIEGALATVDGGYRLEVAEDRVDAVRFAAAIRDGLDHLARGSFHRATEVLAAALSDWSEPPLPDLAHLEATHSDITELAALHHEAEIGHAAAMLESSGWSPEVATLEGLVERHPLDERAWRLLVLGHYRSGGQAAALDAFGRAEIVLDAELGVEPGPRLKEIERQILDQDLRLEPRLPREVELPGFTTPFVGRIETVRQLSKAILEQRLTTLIGTGGVGKTRLAVEAARRSADNFIDGAYFVGLESVDAPDLVGQAIAEGAAIDHSPPTRSPEKVIGGRSLLLVLDNCEHLIETVGETVARILRECPSLSIVATSRTPLGVMGEATWAVAPFELPERDSSIEELKQNESVVFFVESARRVVRDFDLSSGNAASLAGICHDLAGIPLALELAAAQCDVLAPGDLQRLLTSSGDVTGHDDRGRHSRHRSLDDTIDWSLGLLDPGHRDLFGRMAVFAGSVDGRAVAAVCGVDDDRRLTDSLRKLRQSSLITVDLDGDRAGYGQLPPVKQSAQRRMSAREWSDLRRAHATYFLGMAAEAAAQVGTPDGAERYGRIDSMIEEIRLALLTSHQTDPPAGLRAAVALVPYWQSQNRIAEGRQRIHAARTRAHGAAPEEIAAALKAEGTLAHAMSELPEAERLLGDALERYTHLGERASMAATLNNLGVVAVDSGQLELAIERYQRARDLFEREEHPRGLAATALNLGVVELQRERAEAARRWFQTALEGFRSIEDRAEEAHAMQRLADVAYFEGDLETAKTWLHSSRRLNVEIGLTEPIGRADWVLAEIALDSGQIEVARTLATRASREALSLRHHPWWTPGLLETAARIAANDEDRSLAAELVGAASCFRRVRQTSRPAMANPTYQAFFEELRQALGDTYQLAFARGETLSARQALSLVTQRFPDPRRRPGDD